jgi:hypothetical protein
MRSRCLAIQHPGFSKEKTPSADTEQNPYTAIRFLWERDKSLNQTQGFGLAFQDARGPSAGNYEDVKVCKLGIRLGDRDVALESKALVRSCELGDRGYGVCEGLLGWGRRQVGCMREDLEGAGEVESVEMGVRVVEDFQGFTWRGHFGCCDQLN